VTGIVGVLLAAGASRRFGPGKLLHPLPDGEPVGIAAARHLVAALPDAVAVVRAGDQGLADALAAIGLRVVANPLADLGMGTSLAAGVRATADAAGWVVALADMPWIRPETIAAVAQALRAGASLAAPLHAGRRGHPVGFAARWQTALLALGGDAGARDLLAAHAAELSWLPTGDPGVLRDVDQADDLRSDRSGPGGAPGAGDRRGCS
jgi:molybdenum cofactor cytidylyltransferase